MPPKSKTGRRVRGAGIRGALVPLLISLAPWLFITPLLLMATSAARAQGGAASLDGDWNFAIDPSGNMKVADLAAAGSPRVAKVPGSWQSEFSDLRNYAGVAWYWRTAQLEAPRPEQAVLLRFGAVDYRAEVYVNGQKAGSHDGGYLPFEFEVTKLVHSGENQIVVRVVDAGDKPDDVVEGIRYAEIPHGKQNWYVQTSGLWQSVTIETRPRVRLGAVHISARADGGFRIAVPVVSAWPGAISAGDARIRAAIRDSAGKAVWEGTGSPAAGQTQAELAGRVENPRLWSPADPALYTLRVEAGSGDTIEARFGFRTFEARGGRFYLNGKVIYLRGALDQDFYPETAYTPPSLDFIKSEMRAAKSLGLNLLRCHIKVPDPRYLEAADETGVLVWYEIPNWDKLTADAKRRAGETLEGMAERDWNHPSIILVSIINESWGADLREAADRAWLKQAYQGAKKIVPGWLVDDNSACCENFHLATDIADFHQYNAIPDYAADFDRFVTDQATRPGWLFSPYGDASPRGDEPLMLSEFGNWGLPHVPEPKPWWFGRNFEGREITLPEGVEQRFADYGYGAIFGAYDQLVDGTEKREYEALKYEIESIRLHPELQGYVITEFTDINWESNGLLTMWRRPKYDPESYHKLQQDDLVILRSERSNYTVGQNVEAEVYFSHFSDRSLAGASVAWELEGTPLKGSAPLPAVPAGGGARVMRVRFPAPAVSAPSRRTLQVAVSSLELISRNSIDLFFYPPERPELPPPVVFEDPGGKLRRLVNEMHARGYQTPAGGESFPVMIASTFDERVKQSLAAGGRVILLAADRETLAPGIEIVPRAGSDLSGNWISSFPWIRRDAEPFKRLASLSEGPLTGFEAQAVTPAAVVRGVPAARFGDVLSGLFYGWIHSSVGTLVQARAGKGKLLIATFSLGTTYGSDPYATNLLDALVSYAAGGFSPGLEIPLVEVR